MDLNNNVFVSYFEFFTQNHKNNCFCFGLLRRCFMVKIVSLKRKQFFSCEKIIMFFFVSDFYGFKIAFLCGIFTTKKFCFYFGFLFRIFLCLICKLYRIYAYDMSGKISDDIIFENYIFKQNYDHKQCKPMIKYDIITGILYVTFQSCADILALNINNQFKKESLYHSVNDAFMGFEILPKHFTKKREINKMIKFAKNRIQQIVHTRGGKLIYETISSKPKQSQITNIKYFAPNNINFEYNYSELMGKCVDINFLELKKRSVSLYLHITGKEAQSNYEKYFDLKISQTVNCNLGLNIKTNNKYALYPSPTYGGGALGIIKLNNFGRKKQSQLIGHSEKITTFDIGINEYNNNLVITGSPDCKAIISKINEKNEKISLIEKLFTFQCNGKVTFVSFHLRIKNICVIACNKEHSIKKHIIRKKIQLKCIYITEIN